MGNDPSKGGLQTNTQPPLNGTPKRARSRTEKIKTTSTSSSAPSSPKSPKSKSSNKNSKDDTHVSIHDRSESISVEEEDRATIVASISVSKL